MLPAQNIEDWGTSDLLDPWQPLPEMWCSMPQPSLPQEALHPDILFDAFIAGNCGLVPDDALGRGPSPVSVQQDPQNPPIASSQADVRVFACLFFQFGSSSGDAYGHPDIPGSGRLKLISRSSDLRHWFCLIARPERSTQAATCTSNRGKDPQVDHNIPNPPAQRDVGPSFHPSSLAPPPARPSVSGWPQELAFRAQPTYVGPQPSMSAPMSLSALPPYLGPQFNQSRSHRSSYSGPDDSLCPPAVTSIPAAPHYHEAPTSLASPPPTILHMANLNPSISAVHPHMFYQDAAPSMEDRISAPFDPLDYLSLAGPTAPPLAFTTHGALPGYQAEGPALAQWPAEDHERTHQPHGRGRS